MQEKHIHKSLIELININMMYKNKILYKHVTLHTFYNQKLAIIKFKMRKAKKPPKLPLYIIEFF